MILLAPEFPVSAMPDVSSERFGEFGVGEVRREDELRIEIRTRVMRRLERETVPLLRRLGES